MRENRLIAYFRRLVHPERNRLLRPFAHYLHEHTVWRFDRNGVARGVAIGFFFAILFPVAQIVFAVIAALVLRANILVAAGSTLITNPLTIPLVYYFAYRVGSFLIGRTPAVTAAVETIDSADIEVSEEAAAQALVVTDWISTLVEWITSVGPALVVGVIVLALSTALFGYVIVHAAWQAIRLGAVVFGSVNRERR